MKDTERRIIAIISALSLRDPDLLETWIAFGEGLAKHAVKRRAEAARRARAS